MATKRLIENHGVEYDGLLRAAQDFLKSQAAALAAAESVTAYQSSV